MIDINKKYKTRDGCDVRILCTDKVSKKFPVVALVRLAEYEEVRTYTKEGSHLSNYESESDLIEVKEKQVGWINIYNDGGVLHKTKEEADIKGAGSRIACIKIEFEEGEGLE